MFDAASILKDLRSREWQKDNFFISTNPDLIPITELNAMFDTDAVYWTKSIPDEVLKVTVQNSLCFGLYEIISSDATEEKHDGKYEQNDLKFIGIGRCITDFTTFAYLTDVVVSDEYQGKGLGSWLVKCIHAVFETMPHLRRTMLITSDWKRSVPFYENLMGMSVSTATRETGGLAVLYRAWPGATV